LFLRRRKILPVKPGIRASGSSEEQGVCRSNCLHTPPSFADRSLKEPVLRKRCEVRIIAVREQLPERFVMVPGADFVVREGDVPVIPGRETDLTEIREWR